MKTVRGTRFRLFVESMAEGLCYLHASGPDCPIRMKDGKDRPYDWCRRCQAKYWVLQEPLPR